MQLFTICLQRAFLTVISCVMMLPTLTMPMN